MYFFEFADSDVQTILASVLLCHSADDVILFRHASLTHFLCDEGRSREYYINTLATPLCIRGSEDVPQGLRLSQVGDVLGETSTIVKFLGIAAKKSPVSQGPFFA